MKWFSIILTTQSILLLYKDLPPVPLSHHALPCSLCPSHTSIFPSYLPEPPYHQLHISSSTSSQNIYHFLWEAIHYLPNQVLLHMVSIRNATYHPTIAPQYKIYIYLPGYLIIYFKLYSANSQGQKNLFLCSSLVSSIVPDTK